MICSICYCSLQSTFSRRSRRLSFLQLAAIGTLLILCTIPLKTVAAPASAGARVQKRSPTTQSRNHCDYYSVTDQLLCDYHDTCVEDTFRCNSNGFNLKYSKSRCKAVLNLKKATDASCESCLHHDQLIDWVVQTEKCVQPRLLNLANKWSNHVYPLNTPDPQNCIEYEKEALEKLKECYQENITPVCNLLTAENFLEEQFINDLGKLAKTVSISEYYSSTIYSHLRELLSKECLVHDNIINKSIPPPRKRVVFCASINSNQEYDLISQIKNDLKRPYDDFVYADLNTNSGTRDDRCQVKSDTASQAGQMQFFRLIQWTPNVTDTLPDRLEPFYRKQISATKHFVFFMYKSDTSTCGNGLREVGEMCDTFGDLGIEQYGCSDECTPFEDYECSPAQLALSECNQHSCGNGMRTSIEECDDGNMDANDGCSPQCTIEAYYECPELPYNSTSVCTRLPLPSQKSSTHLPIIPTSVVQSVTTTITSTTVATTTVTTVTNAATRTLAPTPTIVEVLSEEVLSSGPSAVRTSTWWFALILVLVSTACVTSLCR